MANMKVDMRLTLPLNRAMKKPVLLPVASQQLREGDRFSLQLSGQLPHGLSQYPGYDIELKYSAEWLPSGAVLNKEIGWLEDTRFRSGRTVRYSIAIGCDFLYPVNGGVPVRTVATQVMSLIVNNAMQPLSLSLQTGLYWKVQVFD